MRFIPTRVHGVLDYLTGAFLIAMPWVMGFGSMWGETVVPMVLGFTAICYSLVTTYEWGLTGILTMRNHLWLDFGSGVFLALSPWLFGFADKVWVPHVVVGLFEVAVAATTRLVPERAPHTVDSIVEAHRIYHT
jgi:hypothetical protein